jgi:hypothetical protein
MSITDRALKGTGRFLDDRLRAAPSVWVFLRKIFPDHWSFLLGEIALYSFVILLLTGTFLTFFFQPSTTWIARIAIFAGPVIAYWVTKRICLGLQRKDAHLLEHGVETGIIRQLPNGQYVELTRPVDEEKRAVLEYKRVGAPQLPASRPGEDADEVPAPGTRGPLGRLRLGLNRVLTEGIPRPSTNPDGHDGQAGQPTGATADEAGDPGHEQAGAENPERKEHRTGCRAPAGGSP